MTVLDHISHLYLKKYLKQKLIKAIKNNILVSIVEDLSKIEIDKIKEEELCKIQHYSFRATIPLNISSEEIMLNEDIDYFSPYYKICSKLAYIKGQICHYGKGLTLPDEKRADSHIIPRFNCHCYKYRIQNNKLYLIIFVSIDGEI